MVVVLEGFVVFEVDVDGVGGEYCEYEENVVEELEVFFDVGVLIFLEIIVVSFEYFELFGGDVGVGFDDGLFFLDGYGDRLEFLECLFLEVGVGGGVEGEVGYEVVVEDVEECEGDVVVNVFGGEVDVEEG